MRKIWIPTSPRKLEPNSPLVIRAKTLKCTDKPKLNMQKAESMTFIRTSSVVRSSANRHSTSIVGNRFLLTLLPAMSDVPRAVRLVYHDAKGRFRMGTEAVSILERVKGPIGVVSVCGPSQEGKSYMSNQLLGRTSGFRVKALFPDACTKGLWLWSSPLKKNSADGTEYNFFVIDTEGLDSCAHAGQYLYLAIVLSSMLLYNEMGQIHDPSFICLSLLTKMTDKTAGLTTASEICQISTIFVWVLRDFTINLVGMSPTEFMESGLKPVEGRQDSKALKQTNEARKSLKAVFPDRYCFTLVRPMAEERDLMVLNKISMDRLRPEFKIGMDKLKGFVLEKTKPKKIGGTVMMTGPMFVKITEDILDAFNTGKRPMIPCVWEDVGKSNPRKALKSATTATLVGNPPAANTRQRRRSMEQRMPSQ